MPTQLLFAPAAGGKTAYVLDLARQTAVSLQHEVRICVPTGLQAQAWRRRLAAAGGAIGVHVLTFDRLVATCLDQAHEAYTELSDPVQYRLLRTVIDRLPLAHYAPLKAKPGFIQINQQLIAELKSALVDPADFTNAVAQMGGEPRLRELADIYAAYQAQLRAHGWADRVGLHWLALEALQARASAACREWPLLIVDGFDDFTASQLALLALLAQRVQRCVVTLPRAAQAHYPRYEQTAAAVARALGVDGRSLPAHPVTSHPTLAHLAHTLFAAPTDAPIAAADALDLHEVTDRAAEARTALRWLKQRIVWDGVPADQVALLARDVAPYRPFIRQAAAEFGLPLRLVDGLPLPHSPVIAALLALLRLHLPIDAGGAPGLARRPVVAAWRAPYFHWGDGSAAIAPADADRLDALARQHRVIRGLAQWQEAFAAAAAAADAADAPYEEDDAGEGSRLNAAQVAALRQKFDHFLARTQPPAAAATLRDFVQWLETLIGLDPQAPGDQPQPAGSLRIVAQARRSPATAAADVAALRALKEILRGLVWAEAAVGQQQPVDYALFFAELVGAIAAARYLPPPRPGQPEILVASVLQARGLSFAAVAVLGLGEGAFPATIAEDPFLRDADRRILREQFGFALPPSTRSAEREFFYEAVTRARDRLLLTRPVLADNGADWVASPFWKETRDRVAAEPQKLGSTAVLPPAETASWVEWWETAAAHGAPDASMAADAAVWQQIETAAAIWRARQAGETSAWQGDLSALAAALGARFGAAHVWSASRLEAYQTCGFFFFVQNVLRVEPRVEPAEGLDARQLGSLYHAIFEQVTAGGLPEPLTETAVQAHVAAVAAPLLDAAPAQQGFRQTPWWAQTRQEIVANVARSILALADGAYTFYRAEAAFGIDGPPLVIGAGDAQLRLRGFIDRIDRRADGALRIVDYKAGGKYAYSPQAFQQGKKLQLPLYALAAQEALGLGAVADGFYWHFQQAEPSGFQLHKAPGGVGEAIETAVAHAWAAVAQIRGGQFAPRPPEGGCPDYCPAAAFCWQFSPRGW